MYVLGTLEYLLVSCPTFWSLVYAYIKYFLVSSIILLCRPCKITFYLKRFLKTFFYPGMRLNFVKLTSTLSSAPTLSNWRRIIIFFSLPNSLAAGGFSLLKRDSTGCSNSSYVLSKCADTDENFCPLLWWKQNALELPYWAEAANKTLPLQPSSAASEHVFSLLKASFSEQQNNALQDYLGASLVLQYNQH